MVEISTQVIRKSRHRTVALCGGFLQSLGKNRIQIPAKLTTEFFEGCTAFFRLVPAGSRGSGLGGEWRLGFHDAFHQLRRCARLGSSGVLSSQKNVEQHPCGVNVRGGRYCATGDLFGSGELGVMGPLPSTVSCVVLSASAPRPTAWQFQSPTA